MIVVQAMTNFVLKLETLVENRKGEDLLIFICCEQVYHNVGSVKATYWGQLLWVEVSYRHDIRACGPHRQHSPVSSMSHRVKSSIDTTTNEVLKTLQKCT